MQALSASLGGLVENVLYATDFHGHSAKALPYALSIARRYGSTVYLVHVIAMSPFSSPGPTGSLRAIESQAIREAKESGAELSLVCGQIPNEVVIRKGDIWKELSAVVEQKRINLIVVGTHGRQGVRKMIMGSVAEKIFRHAPCPVLTIGPRIHGEPDRFDDLHSILLPMDFSPESLSAVSYATSLTQANQARLYLLHVTSSSDDVPAASVKQALQNLTPPGSKLSFAPKALVESGVPSETILDVAEELAVDLIVLGVKRPSILQGTSTHQAMATACKVVSGAGCPVITVRAPA
ncbi:MAG: universal stress protein [Candidatus Acidiferrales bacterium]|jgi:nucleotide-binding universal stress UspA family protein